VELAPRSLLRACAWRLVVKAGLPSLAAAGAATVAGGCVPYSTNVVIENRYTSATPAPLVIYRAAWHAIAFKEPIAPGTSSAAEVTLPASSNTAYVLVAPGWDPASATKPTKLVVLQSRDGFEVHLDTTLHIPVDDTTFAGNCAAGSRLSQADADVLTRLVFPGDFAGVTYDAATCTMIPRAGAGAP
jgi:hypothetical protein